MSIQNDMSIDEAIEEIEYARAFNEANTSLMRAWDLIIGYVKDNQTSEQDEILTLEELREMDGQPIWVCDAISPFWKGWAVLDADKAYLPGIAYRWYDLKDYRKNWFAYRHKKGPSHE